MKIPPENYNPSQIPELLLAVVELCYLFLPCYTMGIFKLQGRLLALSQHSCSERMQINSIQSIHQNLVKLGNSGAWAWVSLLVFFPF